MISGRFSASAFFVNSRTPGDTQQKPYASEAPGISVFYRDDGGAIFHTYSTYARGLDMLNGAYHLLDLVPKGRDEASLPHHSGWLRRRDEYVD